jgi:hypothetical protein
MSLHVPPQIVHAAPSAQPPGAQVPFVQVSGRVHALPSQLALPFGLNRQVAAQQESPSPHLRIPAPPPMDAPHPIPQTHEQRRSLE